MPLSPQAVVNIAVQAAENKKAMDVTVLDIKAVSVIADYFVICSGRTVTQVRAIVEKIQEELKKEGVIAFGREGYREANWVLLDYGDVIIHVFQEAERTFYNLERLWGDARVVPVPVNI